MLVPEVFANQHSGYYGSADNQETFWQLMRIRYSKLVVGRELILDCGPTVTAGKG